MKEFRQITGYVLMLLSASLLAAYIVSKCFGIDEIAMLIIALVMMAVGVSINADEFFSNTD